MLSINCPWCGPRAENEFRCGGEAHISRPSEPECVSDDEWADYLFFRENPKGQHLERWHHRFGCGRWFNVVRHTVSHTISLVYPMGTPRPDIKPEAGK